MPKQRERPPREGWPRGVDPRREPRPPSADMHRAKRRMERSGRADPRTARRAEPWMERSGRADLRMARRFARSRRADLRMARRLARSRRADLRVARRLARSRRTNAWRVGPGARPTEQQRTRQHLTARHPRLALAARATCDMRSAASRLLATRVVQNGRAKKGTVPFTGQLSFDSDRRSIRPPDKRRRASARNLPTADRGPRLGA